MSKTIDLLLMDFPPTRATIVASAYGRGTVKELTCFPELRPDTPILLE
jgi:hypothetical protein